jgi:hypothetical protein
MKRMMTALMGLALMLTLSSASFAKGDCCKKKDECCKKDSSKCCKHQKEKK